MKYLVLLLMTVFTGCAYDGPSGLVCNDEGEASGNRICRDGLWIKTGDSILDMSSDGIHDAGDGSHDTETDAESDVETDVIEVCVPESMSETCLRVGADCGSRSAVNNCGEPVSVACGTCMSPLECGLGGTENVCGCMGSDNVALCNGFGVGTCGTINVVDPACGGAARDVICPGCGDAEICTNNVCECVPESDTQFCDRLVAECGTVEELDNCGNRRRVACESTCSSPEKCGFPAANKCGCDPTTICSQLTIQCGPANVSASCPGLTTVDCGVCANGSCNAANTCDCDTGYALILGTCQDIDECINNNGGCSADAICTNKVGSRTCACKPGFNGDGVTCTAIPPLPQITQTVDTSGTARQITTQSMTNNSAEALFIAFVSIRSGGLRHVTGITGLGLTWASPTMRQCNRGKTEYLEAWVARGVASTGTVQINFNGETYASAATVLRIDGADTSPNAYLTAQNANGGGCGGGSDTTSYSWDVDQRGADRVLIAATSTLGVAHTPGTSWVAHSEKARTNNSYKTRHFVFTKATTGTGDTQVNGTFDANTHWSSIVVNIPTP